MPQTNRRKPITGGPVPRQSGLIQHWAKIALLLLAALIASASGESPAQPDDFERWYVASLMNQPAGWMVSRVKRTDARIITTQNLHIAIRRGAATVTVEMNTEFVETPDGQPIKATVVQKMANNATTREIRFTDDGMELINEQFGRKTRRTLPAVAEPWLPPDAARRALAEAIDRKRDTIEVTTLDPSSSMEPIRVKMRIVGPRQIEVYGKTVPAVEVESQVTLAGGMQLTATEFVDDRGHALRSDVSAGFFTLQLEAADEALAKAQVRPPELLAQTLVQPNQPITQPRSVEHGVYVLRLKQGELPDLPTGPTQQVMPSSDQQSARVTVTTAPQSTEPQEAEPAEPPLKHTATADGRDPQVKALTAQALQGVGSDPAVRAEGLRRFVRRHIQAKNLSVGMATASEVARTRTGDCTEHAVLLAAMLRSAGIPARAASGLMYVDQFIGQRGVFGYHMWTQAWLDGRWVDLDAMLDEVPFDATHITLSVSDLDETGMTNDLVQLVPIIGNLQISILKVE